MSCSTIEEVNDLAREIFLEMIAARTMAYPSNLWQSVRKAFGLKYHQTVMCNEASMVETSYELAEFFLSRRLTPPEVRVVGKGTPVEFPPGGIQTSSIKPGEFLFSDREYDRLKSKLNE